MATDYYSQYGAGVLAATIDAYWRERGYLGIRVSRFEVWPGAGVFGIRSNIGPTGYPPRL
jgi:hypothetical protein